MDRNMRRKRLHLLAAAAVVIVTLAVLYLMGSTLLTLGISVVIAHVLLPVARLLERAMPWRRSRPGLSRGIAIGIIFLAGLGVLGGALALVIPPTIHQGQRFIEGFPGFLNTSRITLEGWIAQYADLIPANIRDSAEETLADAGGIVGRAAWNVVSQTLGVISGSFAFILGLATAPVLIFYLMKDSGPIKASLYAPFPPELRSHLRDILDIIDRTLGGYIRGQLTLGVIVGVIITAGLLLLGVPFAFILGIVAGLTELVPIIGPWIGGAAGVLVTLATEPDKILWVILLYLVVQLLENTLLVPRIQGNTLKLHPIAVIMVIVVASQYFGLWGVILGPPLVAMGKDIIVYLAQEWNRPIVSEDMEEVADTDEQDEEKLGPASAEPLEG
jgi:predicted PurR-regulated permease PerM